MNRTGTEVESIPRYSVSHLNASIGALLERGFPPRFLLEGTVSRPQSKKGHLWLTLTDGEASISAVIWSSQRAKLSFIPTDGDGVVVVGRLNFWTTRANLCVQVLDVRPTLTAVLRQFETVRSLLAPQGFFDPERKRPLPALPRRVALLTSVPSSALADMLRTARERWPSTALLVIPIPVQGQVGEAIRTAVDGVSQRAGELGLDALVLARGGGSREDLAVFDGELLARSLASCRIPVITGLGHEDDLTIADLVADYRAATPTAALVALLPDRHAVMEGMRQRRLHLRELVELRLRGLRQQLVRDRRALTECHPGTLLERLRKHLRHQERLLAALSPQHLLERGFCLLRDEEDRLVRSVRHLRTGMTMRVDVMDGQVQGQITAIRPAVVTNPTPPELRS